MVQLSNSTTSDGPERAISGQEHEGVSHLAGGQPVEARRLTGKGLVATGVRHQFNNLLAVVMGHAEAALEEMADNDPWRDSMERILAAAVQAADLAARTLGHANAAVDRRKRVSFFRLIEEAVQLARTDMPSNVDIRLTAPETLPFVKGEPTSLGQVLINLLSNAVESYKGRGGNVEVTARVMSGDEAAGLLGDELTGRESETFVYCEVRDRGKGMDEEIQARLFETFFTTRPGGKGMGLLSVKQVLASVRGALRIESAPGEGTVVRIALPAVGGTDGGGGVPAAAPRGEREGRTCILVVDDEEGIRALIRLTLERAGYRTLLASSGREGVSRFEAHADSIALVILDQGMADLTGREVFKQIHSLRPDVRVLCMSGYLPESILESYGDTQPAGYLQKPFSPAELLRQVQAILAEA